MPRGDLGLSVVGAAGLSRCELAKIGLAKVGISTL